MRNRAVISFCVLIALLTGILFRVLDLTQGEELHHVAQTQNRYIMNLGKTRGTIYDCNLFPLTNTQTATRAVAIATPESVSAIRKVFSMEQAEKLLAQMKNGAPVSFEWPGESNPSAEGLVVYELAQRYAVDTGAAHVVGYVNADGKGVAGIEAAFDSWLSNAGGELSLSYRADALGRALAGEPLTLQNSTQNSEDGIVLTLDEKIQKIVLQATKKHFSTGAAVVLEVKSAKIRAMVSLPDYDPNQIESFLQAENSPLLNRALCAYNVGSVFKPIVACAAADQNETDLQLFCNGTLDFAQRTFQCIGAIGHGNVGISKAIANSCNCYFILLAQRLGGQAILNKAQRLGLGKELYLASGIVSQAGVLPNLQDLSAPAALANLSFGQGELMATPLQIAAAIRAIADDGCYLAPSLIEGEYKNGYLHPVSAQQVKIRAVTAHTASLVRSYMIEAVETGTVRGGKPKQGGAGAKTATAETGVPGADGQPMVQAWCAGFFPAENPEYVIVILAENGKSGSRVCAPVFGEIADGIWQLTQQEERNFDNAR